MMNTVNTSTGFSGFQLMTGQSPGVIPLLLTISSPPDHDSEVNNGVADTHMVLQRLEDDIQAAKDNLLLVKVSQAAQKNKGCSAEKLYAIGDKVMLSTFHQQRDYVQTGQNCVTKFMPRFNGPYMITSTFPLHSVYTIDMPNSPELYSHFHATLLKPFIPNNKELFPSHIHLHPGMVITEKGEEWFIDQIIDERKHSRGYQYLVRWGGEGPEMDSWLPRAEVEECEALDVWLKSNNHL